MPSEERFNCIISPVSVPYDTPGSTSLICLSDVRNGEWRHWGKMPFFRLSSQTMIVLKSHFTTRWRVCKARGDGASQGAVRLLRRMQVVQVDVKRQGDKNISKWHRGLRLHYTGFKFHRPAHLGANSLLIWSISPKARPCKPRCSTEIRRAGLLQTQLFLPVHFVGCRSIWLLQLV